MSLKFIFWKYPVFCLINSTFPILRKTIVFIQLKLKQINKQTSVILSDKKMSGATGLKTFRSCIISWSPLQHSAVSRSGPQPVSWCYMVVSLLAPFPGQSFSAKVTTFLWSQDLVSITCHSTKPQNFLPTLLKC